MMRRNAIAIACTLVVWLASSATAQARIETGGPALEAPGADELSTLLEAERQLLELHEAGAPDLLETDLRPDYLAVSDGATQGSSTVDDADDRPPASLRVLAETAGALAGAVGGSSVGLVGGLTVGILAVPAQQDFFAGLAIVAFTSLVGTSVGFLAGTPLGLWLGGKLLEGEGNLLLTYVGSIAGLGTAIALGVGFTSLTGWYVGPTASWAVLLSFPIAGGIIGYELSHGAKVGNDDETATAPPRLTPTFTLHTPKASPDKGIDGATAGIRLRF